MSVNKVNSDGSLLRVAGAGGGGGLLPHLIIISEDGESEVKAVKGSTEIIATRTSAGHYECDVPEFGTWTIHAVLNGDDAQVNLVVDTVKVYTVDDSHFHADITVTFPYNLSATCSCSKEGTTTLYATESPYTFTVHEAGTYTLTCNYDGNDYTDTVTISTSGSTFTKVLPVPATAPTDDINLWLFYGGIDNSQGTYSTLSDILADSTALSALMSSNVASDYLVRNTSWATPVTLNEDAMTYIGLNNYASNTLIADSTWHNAICNSTYFESVLNAKTPIMNSNNTPEGQAIAESEFGNHWYDAWKAFDKGTASAYSWWIADQGHKNSWIGYTFPTEVTLCIAELVSNGGDNYFSTSGTIHIQNGSDIDLATDTYSGAAYTKKMIIPPSNNNKDYTFKVQFTNENGQYSHIQEIQFYGRKDV